MLRVPAVGDPPVNAATPTQSTATLLARVRAGDALAREQLCSQYLPLLMSWAHGRLPAAARDLAETADLVQMTLIKALGRIDEFEPRHEGAFLAYLRSALLNALRNEIDRSLRRGERVAVEAVDSNAQGVSSPAADTDLMCDYERALAELAPETREAVLLRLEFGFSYEEIAAAMDRPSANAARMLVHRAVDVLSKRMATD
jgi:RNA polymerase sigma-70 factor (ECF subfamily)